jgi:hypothetical protein
VIRVIRCCENFLYGFKGAFGVRAAAAAFAGLGQSWATSTGDQAAGARLSATVKLTDRLDMVCVVCYKSKEYKKCAVSGDAGPFTVSDKGGIL